MSKEMQLIFEGWNTFVLQEAPLETVGDLRKLIKTHRAAQAGKELGKKAAEAAIEQIPVDDPIEVAFINDLLKAMENMDDLDPIPDVNAELQKYLADKFNSNQVKK